MDTKILKQKLNLAQYFSRTRLSAVSPLFVTNKIIYFLVEIALLLIFPLINTHLCLNSCLIAAGKSPRKRVKRIQSGMNFDHCCPINNDIIVPNDLLQIRADEMEIKRRLNCFIERKREEIDINNVHDFIAEEDADSTCARVNSTVHRAKGSNTHLKVHRVKNEFGPQTLNYTNALDKLMANASPMKIKPDPDAPTITVPQSINERIVNAETYLNMPAAATKSIFERLKGIENRILYLEALSPEYGHFLVRNRTLVFRCKLRIDSLFSNFVLQEKSTSTKGSLNGDAPATEIKKERKKVFTTSELDELIHKFETKNDE